MKQLTIVVGGELAGRPVARASLGALTIGVLAEGEARVVELRIDGGANLLAETPTAGWETPWGPFALVGGHRLWRSPQSVAGADAPDMPVEVTALPDGLCLAQGADAAGAAKRTSVRLLDECTVAVEHEIRNDGDGVVRWAAWGITQLPLGGTVVVPMPASDPASTSSSPNRSLVLWPQADVADPRIAWSADGLVFTASAGPLTKVGALSTLGRVAYLRDGVLLVKSFAVDPARTHHDLSTNVQVYGDTSVVEVETLGATSELAPGQSCTHAETWTVRTCAADPGAVRDLILA